MADKTDKTCERCGKTFALPCRLKTHQQRKTPCAPIVDQFTLSGADKQKTHACKYCRRRFATQISMYRHVRQNCKIANSEEGMDKLMEHTIQRQLAEVQAQNMEMKAQMAELAALLKGQLTVAPQGTAPMPAVVAVQNQGGATVNTGPVTDNSSVVTNVTNVTQVGQQVLYLRPWCEDAMWISATMLLEVFTTNPRLADYCTFSYEEKTNAEAAVPYVLEVLLEFVKRAHTDPAARNVYLNPRRADQVLVFAAEAGGTWKVITLVDAIRALFDGVASGLQRAMQNGQTVHALPPGVRDAAMFVPAMYRYAPDKYVAKARAPMAAHLTNTAPSPSARAQLFEGPPYSEEAPQTVREPPQAVAPPQKSPPTATQPASRPPPFTAHDAAAVLQKCRPAGPGEASEGYIRALVRAAGVDASRLVLKLWEAAEDRLLSAEDALTARAVVTEYDLDPQRYD
jgi:hypothetical protein